MMPGRACCPVPQASMVTGEAASPATAEWLHAARKSVAVSASVAATLVSLMGRSRSGRPAVTLRYRKNIFTGNERKPVGLKSHDGMYEVSVRTRAPAARFGQGRLRPGLP